MNQPKFPISDRDMQNLLQKYPFLRYRNKMTGEQCYQGRSKNVAMNWYKCFDGHGWEHLWKHKYLPALFNEYDHKMSHGEKKRFFFTDVKSKFGMLRVYVSWKLSSDTETFAEIISSYTCENCGDEPRDGQGHRFIYTTKGWVTNLCKNCAIEYLERQHYSKSDIDKMLNCMKHALSLDELTLSECSVITETSDGWLEIK